MKIPETVISASKRDIDKPQAQSKAQAQAQSQAKSKANRRMRNRPERDRLKKSALNPEKVKSSLWWFVFLASWAFGAAIFLGSAVSGDSAVLPFLGLLLLHTAILPKWRQIKFVLLAITVTGYLAVNPELFEGSGLKIMAYEEFKQQKPQFFKEIRTDSEQGNFNEALKKLNNLKFQDSDVEKLKQEILKAEKSASKNNNKKEPPIEEPPIEQQRKSQPPETESPETGPPTDESIDPGSGSGSDPGIEL